MANEGMHIGKEVPAGEVRLRTIAMPADTNPNGDIFGGWLLAQMDLAGGSHAYHQAGGRVATVGIEAMSFHLPVWVGDEVSCYCRTARIGRTSIGVEVETWVRRHRGGKVEKVTEGVLTFVAIDEQGRKRSIRIP
jgi:acyl-CoA thioesterase YciA